MLNLLTIFASMWLFYVLASINIRTVAKGHYWESALTDGGIATVQFILIQHVAAAKTFEEQLAYTLGGIAGGATGIWLSKRYYKEA